jgi:type IV secretory pathway VirB6-like protein
MIGYQFFTKECRNKVVNIAILLAVFLLSHHQIALAITTTPGCNKLIDQNCDNSCIASESIFNSITNYVDQSPVFDANYSMYDMSFNMIAAEGSQSGTNPADGTPIDGCIDGDGTVSFYYNSPTITNTPAPACSPSTLGLNPTIFPTGCSGYSYTYSYGNNVSGTETVTNSPTTITSVNVQTTNNPNITTSGSTTTSSMSNGTSKKVTTSISTDYPTTPPPAAIVTTANGVTTSTITFADGSKSVTTTTNGVKSAPVYTSANITYNGKAATTQTMPDSSGNGTITTISQTVTSPSTDKGITTTGTDSNGNPTSTVIYSDGSSSVTTTITTTRMAPAPNETNDPTTGNKTISYYDGSSTNYINGTISTSTSTTSKHCPLSNKNCLCDTSQSNCSCSLNISSWDYKCTLTTTTTTTSSPQLYTLNPGDTIQVTTNNANDTNLRAISTLDYICVEVESLYGWVPLGCAPSSSQTVSPPPCFKFPQFGFPITGAVMACVTDAINSTFVNGNSSTSYQTNADSAVTNVSTTSGVLSSLSNFQIGMQNAVMGFLVLYVIIFGMKLVLGQEMPNKGELFMFVTKMILVIYFSVGLPAGSPAAANGNLSRSTNGVQDIIMPGFQALALTLSEVIIDAENNSNSSANTKNSATQQLAAKAREADAIRQSADRACTTATDTYDQSNKALANTIEQLTIFSVIGAIVLDECYVGGAIASPLAPLCILGSAVVASGIMGTTTLEENYKPVNDENLSAKNSACAASAAADEASKAADAALAAVGNNSTPSSLCYFAPSSYGPKYEYLSTWDNLDCHVAYYLGFLSAGDIARDVTMVLAVFFTGFFALIFSGQLVFAVFSIVIGILLLSIIVFFVNTYLVSLIGIAILSFLSPLFVPLCLLKVTKGYFDLWLKLLLSFALQPVVITAFVAIMCTTLDQIIYGTCTWVSTSSGFWTISKSSSHDAGCTGSLGAIMNFTGSPSQGAADFFVTTMPFYIFDPQIMVPLFTATLFCFLFYFMAQNITEFAQELVGGPNLSDFSGIKSNSVFNASMSRIHKMLPQMSKGEKTGEGHTGEDHGHDNVSVRDGGNSHGVEVSSAKPNADISVSKIAETKL